MFFPATTSSPTPPPKLQYFIGLLQQSCEYSFLYSNQEKESYLDGRKSWQGPFPTSFDKTIFLVNLRQQKKTKYWLSVSITIAALIYLSQFYTIHHTCMPTLLKENFRNITMDTSGI